MGNADSAYTIHSYGFYGNAVLQWILQPISLVNQAFLYIPRGPDETSYHTHDGIQDVRGFFQLSEPFIERFLFSVQLINNN